jgi:hypothetical protein
MYGIDGSNHPDIYSIDQWYVPLTNGSILWLVRNSSTYDRDDDDDDDDINLRPRDLPKGIRTC